MDTYVAWRLSKAGAAAADAGIIRQRARTFASTAAKTKGTTTLLVVKAANGEIERYVVGASGQSRAAAQRAADVVGASISERPVELPIMQCDVIVEAVAARGNSAAQETQSGSDIAVVSESFTSAATPGDWLAVTFAEPKKRHRKANNAWREGVATHHSREGEAMLATITAGGSDADDVTRMMNSVVAAMPGFDIHIDAKPIGMGGANWAMLPLSVGIAALVGLAPHDLSEAALKTYSFDAQHHWDTAALSALLPAGIFAGAAFEAPWSKYARTLRNLDRGVFPRPKMTAHQYDANKENSKMPDYPLDRRTFMLGPDVAIGLVTSEASGSTDATTTAARRIPAAFGSNIGPMFTEGGWLDADMLYGGIAAIGKAGSGKSVLVRDIFGYVVADKVRQSGIAGMTGKNTTVVAFETKSEGADYYERWARDMAGDDPLRMDVGDVTTPAIDMFGQDGTHTERARQFVEAMRYAFPEGSIESRSKESLNAAFAGALWAVENDAIHTPMYEGASVIRLAHVLLGGDGDANAVLIYDQIKDKANVDGTPDEVVLRLAPMFNGATPSARRNLSEAPRNKVEQLLGIDAWFAPKRARREWTHLLEDHETLILNLSAADGRITDEQSTLIASMLTFGMRNAIRSTCSNWRELGRSVYVFADELSELAGSSPEVVEWLREKGRSFGVRLVFATQRPGQLADLIRESLKGYHTMFWFSQDADTVASEAATDLSLGGNEWTPSEVANLPLYVAAVRSTVGGQRQAPFTAKIAFYEHRLTETWSPEAWLRAVDMIDRPVVTPTPDRSWMVTPAPISFDKPQAETGSHTVDANEVNEANNRVANVVSDDGGFLNEPPPAGFDPSDESTW